MDPTLEHSQHILEEEYDEDYEPTEEEILEYCKILGLDPVAEKDLLFIAKEGIKAPLPKEWKPIEYDGGDGDQNIYYFNFATGDSTWEHPCDEFYRKLLQQEREKRHSSGPKGSKGGGQAPSKKKPQVQKRAGSSGLRNGGNMPMKQAGLQQQAPPSALGVGAANHSLQTGLVSQSFPGRLAPLALPGKATPPLTGVGGLPSLKKAPPSLGSLPVPSKSSSLVSSLSGSGKASGSVNGSQSRNLLGKMGEGNGLGVVDLDSVKISNQYEEEEEEEEGSSEFDSEQDSSESINDQFESKLGVTLLGAKDLGLEEDLDSSEDVNKELRKVLELEESESEDSQEEPLERPTIIPGSVPMPHPALELGAGSPDKSLLASLSKSQHVKTRPTHSRGRDRGEVGGGSGKAGLGASIHSLSPLSSPAGSLRDPLPATRPHIGHSPAQSSAAEAADKKMDNSKTDDTKINDRKLDTRKTDDRKIEMVTASLEAEHQTAVEKKSHSEELEKLRERMASELQQLEATLNLEKESKIAELRKTLASEQLAEEADLKARKMAALDALRAQLEEEKEEEEARLMEEKQDTLRKLKQQISQAIEKESKELSESKDRSLAELKQQLNKERESEEAKLRLESRTGLDELRERLEREMEGERKSMDATHKQEIEAFKKEKEEELKKERQALEEKQREAVETLQRELENEHEDEVRKVRAEAEKGFDLETVRAQVEKSFKQVELEMSNNLGAELEGKRSELISQHEQELSTLKKQLEAKIKESKEELDRKVEAERVKLELEFDAARLSHTQEHQSKIQEMQQQYQSIKSQIELEQTQQSEVLESMQLEYRDSKEKLASLQGDVEKQLQGIQERQRSLQDQEAELKVEEEQLAQLRAASANETEELLKKQMSDLKDAILQEKKTLKSLKESRIAVESEVKELNQHKMTLELRVEQLGQEELRHRESTTQRPTAEAKQHSPILDHHPAPSHTKAEGGLSLGGDEDTVQSASSAVQLKEALNGGPTRGVRGRKMEGSWEEEEEETGHSDSAMDILDLEPPVSKGKGKGRAKPDPPFEIMRAKLAKHQRELCDTLTEEKRSLSKTKTYLRQQERNLKERRAMLEQTHREWNEGIRSHEDGAKKVGHQSQDGNLTLMKEIQSKLDQEAAALSELEERMKSSNKLLTLKEQAVSQLQATIDPRIDPMESVDFPTESTYAEQYLSKLDTLLDRHKHSNGDVRERRMTSPLPFSTAREHVSKQARPRQYSKRHVRVSSEGELSSSSSSSSLTSSGDELEHRGQSHSHFVSSAKANPSSVERKWQKEGGRKETHGAIARHHSEVAPPGGKTNDQAAVLHSLYSINFQLGQLLNRVGGPGEGTSGSNHSMPQPTGGGGGPSIGNSSMHLGHTPLSVEEPLGTSSSARWADPVRPRGAVVQGDLDLQKRRHTYSSGQHPTMGTPLPSAAVTSRPSTKELVRNQTDWLKEFRQSVPLLSQLRSCASGMTSSTLPAPPPPLPVFQRSSSGAGISVQQPLKRSQFKPASTAGWRPKLILDSNDNIKLVHV